ncbi:MAG: AAA family ATPase, partial [Acidimicrobiia bacterium]|nr:AAA family ATPase [Acidimicrobiia bacterium]
MTCRTCGATVADGARFCSQCGAAQVETDERRVVTVLFADIVGFTALSEQRDPEGVKRLVDRCFQQLAGDISSFGGVVDKVMGDGIIALFGAPTAHEDDAERAVRAALRMQQTLDSISDVEVPIRMRIGVNTGEVLVGTSTAGGDYTAMGDVMNTASRLEELAEPGEVLVGVATYQATRAAIRYKPAGLLQAKGREEPLQAWVAVEAIRPPGFHRKVSERFVGRQRELAMLEAQARMAFEMKQSQMAVIVGETGQGKTRLVEELASRLHRRYQATVWRGHCVPYGEANVWWPIAEIIRQLFDLDLEADLADVEQAVMAGLNARLSHDALVGIDRTRTALLHALGYVTSLRGGEPTHNRSEVTQAISQMVESELVDRPLIIVIADIHWAGEAVWDLLDRLLNHVNRSELMVLATARDLERPSLFDGRHGTSVIQLGPLHDDSARELLASLQKPGDPPLDDATIDDLVARSGGNPYFLEELAGLVLGRTPVGDGGIRGIYGDLPDTLRGIIAARLDALDPAERALVEDAAVLGRYGSLPGLRILAKERRGVTDIDPELRRLVDKDLLLIDGPRFEFRSELVRDVAYGTLTKEARAYRHRFIARYLEEQQQGRPRTSVVGLIADHYRSAARLSIEVMLMDEAERADLIAKALHWLDLAGDRALAAGESAEAESWFSSGLELATDDLQQANFRYGRAQARCEIHDIAGARDDLHTLKDLAVHDPLLSARALLITGDVSRKAGDLAEAAQQLREAADKLAVLGSTADQALALRLLGLTEMQRSNDSLARQAFEASRDVAARAGDRRSEAWTLQSMAWLAFSQGRIHDANQQASVAIEIFIELGDRSGLAWAQGVQAWVAFHLGQLATAQELVDTLLPSVRRRGDPWAEAMMLNLAASLALWTGRAAEATMLSGEAIEMARRADDTGLEVEAMAVQGRAMVSLGRVTDGSARLEEAFLLADRRRDRFNRRIAIIANCASAARLGEAERALQWASHFDGFHDDLSVVG